MQNKQNTKAKVIVVAIAILLCLALAVGITGAWYQAQRRATGTVKMDKGIVIDYTGFGKDTDGIWQRETTTTFRLFEDADVQPGEKISLNDAGIKANASSVDFYARVKLSYEFYNGETPVALANPSDLITTSATFFGSDWVKSNDGYHYYATGTDLNKFTKATPADFVDLFDSNAQFIIEGAGFTGAENEGEGGGYVVDESTSINKIVVYLTLETLQGDADAAAEGWEITAASDVVFADATAKLETSVGKVETTENLNVSVGGAAEVPLNEVVFPYDTTTTLTFDSNNVEYVTLTYSNGESETFTETAANTYEVYANSSKGTVTGYTVGVFSDSEYTGFTYSTKNTIDNGGGGEEYTVPNGGVAVTGYYGSETSISIPASLKLRNRDFKVVLEYTDYDSFLVGLEGVIGSIQYPCKMNGKTTFNSVNDIIAFIGEYDSDASNFMTDYPSPMTFTYEVLCETTGIFYSSYAVTEIGFYAFAGSAITNITFSEGLLVIGTDAFQECESLESIVIPSSVTNIYKRAFRDCNNLTTTIGEGWVKVEDSSAVDASTLLKDISYDIKRA